MSSCACEVPVVCTMGPCRACRSSWVDVLLLSLAVAVPPAFIFLAAYGTATLSHPSDEELITRFLLHKSDFQALAHMLESDRERLASLGAESFEFPELVQAGADTAQKDAYKVLLARIGATNFRYWPQSGNLFLPVSRSSDSLTQTKKSYLYLNREPPQPLLHHQGYSSWRGPGIYSVTGDRRIEGQWFIHHEGTVVVAFAPY